ncbi:MAG: SLBB domain-containing protein [Planctomycetes bacterium]|nr:SLBB domain-containing protein [Planctomycetota bacterium]
MTRRPHRPSFFWAFLICASILPGCTGRPGSPFGLTQEGQKLLPGTKDLRQSVPDPAPLPRELDKALHPSYLVEPGDVLLVQPAKFDSPVRLPGDQPVLPDGTVNLGQYGRLIVAGKTIDQIEAETRSLVEAQTKDAGPIIVRIVSRQSKVFYVLGEVNAPGAFPLAGRETVLDAILAAGGVTSRANLRGITLSRPTAPDGCRVVLPICYEEIVQIGDTSTNYQIAAGDRVFVPAKGFFEQLCQTNKQCLPCGRSHVSCFALGGSGCPACQPGVLPANPPRYQSTTPPTTARSTATIAQP